MAVGIIIHVSVGAEKRTEIFSEENIRLGASESADLQIHTDKISSKGIWLELEFADGVYRVINFLESLKLTVNGQPMRRFVAVKDGDTIDIPNTDISFSFFRLPRNRH